MADRDELIERVCVLFHNAYELAARDEGWESQVGMVAWVDVPEANKATMRKAVAAVLDQDVGDGRRIAIIERAVTPTDVGEEGWINYCTSHDSPGVWFSDGSGGCMLEQIVEARWDTHYHVPLFRIVTPDPGEEYEPTGEDELLENGFDIDAALGAVAPDPGEA